MLPLNPFVLRWCGPSLVKALLLASKKASIRGQKQCNYMAKGVLLQGKGGENGQKNNVKESIVPIFYIIIYGVSSQYLV